VRAACRWPILTLALGVTLAALSVWLAFGRLTFATSTADLLPRGHADMSRFQEYERLFGDVDELIIVVEASALEDAKAYAARLVRELRERMIPLSYATYRIDPTSFEGRALLYLPTQKLQEIRDRLFDYQDFMESFAARPTVDQLVDGLATQIARSFATGFFDLGLDDNMNTDNDLRFVEELVGQLSTRFQRADGYRSPWSTFFSMDTDGSRAGHFLSYH